MEWLIVGLAVALNVIVVIWKLKRPKRRLDGIVDGTLLVLVAILFSGSTALLIIGTIGSAFISLYLLMFPVRIGNGKA